MKIIFSIVFYFYFIVFNCSVFANYSEAFKAYKMKDWNEAKKLCFNSEDDKCLNLLGVIYLKGNGVTINFDKSFEYFSQAEIKGNKKAMINLGLMYMKGFGREIDIEKAAKYFNDAYKDNSIYKNYSNKSDLIEFDKSLSTLKNNNIIAKYNNFYSYYLKFKTIESSEAGKLIITDNVSELINDKYLIVIEELFRLGVDVDEVNSKIYEEQNILLLLYLSNLNLEKNKFEKELNNVISFINKFSFN